MRIIPGNQIPPLPSDTPPTIFFNRLSELVRQPANIVIDSGASDLSDAESDSHVTGSVARPAAAAAAVRQARAAEVSRTTARDDSVQRVKATFARPGSRRERRWLNRQVLKPTPDDLEMEGSQLLGGLARPRGCFETLFEDPGMLERWDKVLNEGEMPGQARCDTKPAKPRTGALRDNERFALIDRSVRAQLRTTHIPQGTMEEIEQRLLQFYADGGGGAARRQLIDSCDDGADLLSADWVVVDSDTGGGGDGGGGGGGDGRSAAAVAVGCRPGRLQIHEPNSFNRCLLHAIAQYMGLDSASETLSDDRRVTTITNPQTPAFHAPDAPLSQYLTAHHVHDLETEDESGADPQSR